MGSIYAVFKGAKSVLHGRIPRIICPNCGVRQAKVPWARERSGFILLMEALIVFFAQTMQISQISEKLHIKDKRIWRVVTHYVEDALKKADFSNITSFGVDETSRRKVMNILLFLLISIQVE